MGASLLARTGNLPCHGFSIPAFYLCPTLARLLGLLVPDLIRGADSKN